jgi:riboflavin biosynthesis pyrimidine reductase
LRALLPQAFDRVDLVETYSKGLPPPGVGSFVRVNMVSSLDGAVAVAGRAGGLGGPADKLLFNVLRSLADVVLVGAGTFRVERYRAVSLSPELQELRQRRGQARGPVIAIVTQSCRLDWRASIFRTTPRPIVIAPGNADAHALAEARDAADLLTTGVGAVNLTSALKALAERGLHHVLCEGGPTLNTSLAAAQLIDELCLTLSPQLAGCVGGVLLGGWLGSAGVWLSQTDDSGHRTYRSQPLTQLVRLGLVHVLEEDGYLFLRLASGHNGGPPGS